eukprot:3315379-Amphidinium_carterae.1
MEPTHRAGGNLRLMTNCASEVPVEQRRGKFLQTALKKTCSPFYLPEKARPSLFFPLMRSIGDKPWWAYYSSAQRRSKPLNHG